MHDALGGIILSEINREWICELSTAERFAARVLVTTSADSKDFYPGGHDDHRALAARLSRRLGAKAQLTAVFYEGSDKVAEEQVAQAANNAALLLEGPLPPIVQLCASRQAIGQCMGGCPASSS